MPEPLKEKAIKQAKKLKCAIYWLRSNFFHSRTFQLRIYRKIQVLPSNRVFVIFCPAFYYLSEPSYDILLS